MEGTISQAVRRTRIRRTRYTGLPKTHLGHVFAATAINIIRLDAWLTETPLGQTRTSHLARLDLAAQRPAPIRFTDFPTESFSRGRVQSAWTGSPATRVSTARVPATSVSGANRSRSRTERSAAMSSRSRPTSSSLPFTQAEPAV